MGGVSEGAAPGRPRDMLPPPPPLSKTFYQRFLQGKQDTVAAVQELQKLRWSLEKSRTSSPSSPFPCLSLLCSRLISLLVDRNLGLPPADQADVNRRWPSLDWFRDWQGLATTMG